MICASIHTVGLKGICLNDTSWKKDISKNTLDWSSKCYMFIVIILLMEEILKKGSLANY